MGANLRPWLLPFILDNLHSAVEWRRSGSGTDPNWRNDGSNLRRNIVFNDSSDKFLLLQEFTQTSPFIKCRISDGGMQMIARVSSKVEAAFPKDHHGRSIREVVSGSQFTVSAVELVITQYGPLEEQITLDIEVCIFESTTQTFKLAGSPKPMTSHPDIKRLHKTVFSSVKKDTQPRTGYDGALDSVPSQMSPLSEQRVPETQSPASEVEDENHEPEAAETQSQFATQPPPSRKRKRVSESRIGLPDHPPVDVQKDIKRAREGKTDLLSLISGSRPPKRGNIEEIQQGTRETSDDSDDEDFAEAIEKQPDREPREQTTTDTSGEDEKQGPRLETQQTTLESVNAEFESSSQQPWHHIFESSRNIFHIPKDQLEILKAASSWNPPPTGKTFPHGNLPNDVLLEIQHDLLPKPEATPAPRTQAKSPAGSPAESRPASSSIVDLDADDSVGEEEDEFPWSQSPELRPPDSSHPRLPPDTPTFPWKSTADSDMDMAVPRALVQSTDQKSGVSKDSDAVLKVHEEWQEPAGIDSEEPLNVEQIQREIQETSLDKTPPKSVPPAAKEQLRIKPLGDIQYSQVVTEDPSIKAREEREKWFIEQKRATQNAVEQETSRSPHQTNLEIRSPAPKTSPDTENHEIALVPVTPIKPPDLRADSGASAQPSRPSPQMSSSNSRIEASVEQSLVNGKSKDRSVTTAPARPDHKPTATTRSSEVKIKVEEHSSELQPTPGTLPTKSTAPGSTARITQTESLRHSISGRPSMSSTAFVNAQRSVYETFKEAYPEYTGDIDHFTSMCRKIREAQPHRAVWDDFVIRHLSEYTTYVSSRLMKGLDALEYAEYHNKTVTSLKFTKDVLTEELLNSLFPVPKSEKKRRPKSRDGKSKSSDPQDKRR